MQTEKIIKAIHEDIPKISSQLEDNKKNARINIKQFGAIGNGVESDSLSIKNAIEYLKINGGGELTFPKGHYIDKDDNTFDNLPSNINILGLNGAIIDFSKRTDYSSINNKYLMSSFGTIGNEIKLAQDGLVGNYTLYVNSIGDLKEGDLLQVTSDAILTETDSSIYLNVGEIVKINRILGTRIQLKSALNDNYTILENAKIIKINPVKNINISGIKFIGKDRNINPIDDADYGLGFTYGENITVENCLFENIDTIQLEFRSCYKFKVDNCHFEHSKYTTKDANGNVIMPETPVAQSIRGAVQYQIRVSDSCTFGEITACTGEGSRHLFNTGHSGSKRDGTSSNSRGYLYGLSRYISVSNCKSRNTWHAGFSTHNDAEYITFDNCMAINSELAGINIRSKNNTVQNCKVVNVSTGIYLSDNIRGSIIKDNEISNCGGSAILMTSDNNLDFEDITVKNNIIKNCSGGIMFTSNTNLIQSGTINILDNTLIEVGYGSSNSGIRLNFPKGDFIIKNNTLINKSLFISSVGLLVTSANSIEYVDNYIKGYNRNILVTTLSEVYAYNNVSFKCKTQGSFDEFYKAPKNYLHNNVFSNADATNIQQHATIFKNGSLASRPTSGLTKGLSYANTTSGKIEWFDGTVWRDAMGQVSV